MLARGFSTIISPRAESRAQPHGKGYVSQGRSSYLRLQRSGIRSLSRAEASPYLHVQSYDLLAMASFIIIIAGAVMFQATAERYLCNLLLATEVSSSDTGLHPKYTPDRAQMMFT